MYAKLRPLQGRTISILFGEASMEGQRALILSDVGPVSLCNPPAYQKDRDELDDMIYDLFRALAKFGVEHGDIKLDNFHIASGPDGDRIVVVDLESVVKMNHRTPERTMAYTADHLIRQWRDAVMAHRDEWSVLGVKAPSRLSDLDPQEVRRLLNEVAASERITKEF